MTKVKAVYGWNCGMFLISEQQEKLVFFSSRRLVQLVVDWKDEALKARTKGTSDTSLSIAVK